MEAEILHYGVLELLAKELRSLLARKEIPRTVMATAVRAMMMVMSIASDAYLHTIIGASGT